MTYCVGFLLESGLVFASDSRTNAGVDYISSYSKMHVFQPAPDRLFVLMAAGNLGTTQAVLNRIRRDLALDEAAASAAMVSAVNDGPGAPPLWRNPSPPALQTRAMISSQPATSSKLLTMWVGSAWRCSGPSPRP